VTNSLLIGAMIDGAFFILNEQLRASTVSFAQKKLGRILSGYTPWLGFVPLTTEIDICLLHANNYARGGLLADRSQLKALCNLFSQKGKAIIADMPGEASCWFPNDENVSDYYEAGRNHILNAADSLRLLFQSIVDCVVPLGGGMNRGFSSHFARGAIFRSLPSTDSEFDIAFDVVHELGHQTLMVWQSIDPILTSDPAAPVFSQIRRRNRPAIQSFHATAAIAFMRYLELSCPDNAGMRDAGAKRGRQYSESLSKSLSLAITSIRENCTVSSVGDKMLAEMEQLI
jgi:hypothetical protein